MPTKHLRKMNVRNPTWLEFKSQLWPWLYDGSQDIWPSVGGEKYRHRLVRALRILAGNYYKTLERDAEGYKKEDYSFDHEARKKNEKKRLKIEEQLKVVVGKLGLGCYLPMDLHYPAVWLYRRGVLQDIRATECTVTIHDVWQKIGIPVAPVVRGETVDDDDIKYEGVYEENDPEIQFPERRPFGRPAKHEKFFAHADRR